MRAYKRRRFLVDRFQYRLLGIAFLHFLAILLIFAAAAFFAREFLPLHARLWPPLIAALVLLALNSVLVSHRIAGPLYQFRRIFNHIAQGNLAVRARIRKTDYLRKDADSINEMIATLETRTTSIKEQCADAEVLLIELKEAIDSGSVEQMNEHIKNLEVQMERLKLCANQFTTAA